MLLEVKRSWSGGLKEGSHHTWYSKLSSPFAYIGKSNTLLSKPFSHPPLHTYLAATVESLLHLVSSERHRTSDLILSL